jgi:hypothetical protein
MTGSIVDSIVGSCYHCLHLGLPRWKRLKATWLFVCSPNKWVAVHKPVPGRFRSAANPPILVELSHPRKVSFVRSPGRMVVPKRGSGMSGTAILSARTYNGLSLLWVVVAKPHFTKKVSQPSDQCSTSRRGARQGRVQWRVPQLGRRDMLCEKTPTSMPRTLHSKGESRARRVG